MSFSEEGDFSPSFCFFDFISTSPSPYNIDVIHKMLYNIYVAICKVL